MKKNSYSESVCIARPEYGCRRHFSILLVQLEYVIHAFAEHGGHLQGNDRGGHVLPGLYGIDGLPCDADAFSQLLLCHAQDGAFYADVILHRLLPF